MKIEDMDYCKKHKIHPGESWAWQRAETAYNENKRASGNNCKTHDKIK